MFAVIEDWSARLFGSELLHIGYSRQTGGIVLCSQIASSGKEFENEDSICEFPDRIDDPWNAGVRAAEVPAQPDHCLSAGPATYVRGDDFVSVAEAMPEEKYSFAPSSGEFKDVRSFALQVRHVAFANHLFFGTILGEKPPAGVPSPTASGRNGPESLKTKEQIVQYLRESFALGHRAIATITPENLVTVVENAPVPRFNTRLALATHACSHAYDHYGQMVEYLRMNGIVPPASRIQPSSSSK